MATRMPSKCGRIEDEVDVRLTENIGERSWMHTLVE